MNKKKHRKENPNTILALNEDLGNEDWHEVTGENDVNKAYKSFIDKLTHYYNKNVPLVQNKQHKNDIRNPWIT